MRPQVPPPALGGEGAKDKPKFRLRQKGDFRGDPERLLRKGNRRLAPGGSEATGRRKASVLTEMLDRMWRVCMNRLDYLFDWHHYRDSGIYPFNRQSGARICLYIIDFARLHVEVTMNDSKKELNWATG